MLDAAGSQDGSKPEPEPKTMKTLVNITASVANTRGEFTVPEKTFSFIRRRSAKTPTYRGAERMVAAQVGCKPRDVSVHRIQVQSYAAR